jgi:N-acetylglutamate synthase-like GNAT family acetyltransferase/DNA-binding MarR family transcriptional regulator
MPQDTLSDFGFLFLGSRMKRLAERMQADATRIFEATGHGRLFAAFNTILATLDRHGDVAIGDLVNLIGISQPAITRTVAGMVEKNFVTLIPSDTDQRVKMVRLTDEGRRIVADLKITAWPQIAAAACNLCADAGSADLLDRLAALEANLIAKPLTERTQLASSLSIVEYSDGLAGVFYELNADWIRTMFTMEKTDEEVLSNPRKSVLDRGGDILFVRNAEGEIVGVGALQPVGDEGEFEFTKMAVAANKRGQKAGEFLLIALIRRAKEMGVKRLHLLTNKKCEAAIHLYEKLGFHHSDEVMQNFAVKYKRADVAMRYPI